MYAPGPDAYQQRAAWERPLAMDSPHGITIDFGHVSTRIYLADTSQKRVVGTWTTPLLSGVRNSQMLQEITGIDSDEAYELLPTLGDTEALPGNKTLADFQQHMAPDFEQFCVFFQDNVLNRFSVPTDPRRVIGVVLVGGGANFPGLVDFIRTRFTGINVSVPGTVAFMARALMMMQS